MNDTQSKRNRWIGDFLSHDYEEATVEVPHRDVPETRPAVARPRDDSTEAWEAIPSSHR